MDNINITEWSVISEDKFKAMQFDSGVLLSAFDPADPDVPDSEDVICATTGNITITCTPELVDLGEDVNNLHGEIGELQYISSWQCQIQFTALEMTADTLKLALAAAAHTQATGKVAPRMNLTAADFQNVWWVGALIGGGFVAVKLSNALNTAGLSLTTSKDGKGNLAVTLKGFVTFDSQDTVPMEFYALPGT